MNVSVLLPDGLVTVHVTTPWPYFATARESTEKSVADPKKTPKLNVKNNINYWLSKSN